MNYKKNFISALIYQAASIIYGLVLPRLIIVSFGSEVNGLISSITQFLSFIALLEGGLGAVVLAELYVPIENRDDNAIINVLYSCQKFFTNIAYVFIIYTVILSVVYGINYIDSYSFSYTSTLVLILSASTLSQYLFSITNRLLLQAQQKIYIINIVATITIFLNLLSAIIVIMMYPSIHVLKIGASMVFLLQPVIFNKYVDTKYKIKLKAKREFVLKNRWSGFGQNLAHFINMNTDVAIITVFSGLSAVSVYSVYMLAINALRSIVVSVDNSFQSALGKFYAEGNKEKLKKQFEVFEMFNSLITMILFYTCVMLINPFVSIYTKGVTDIKYYEPRFAFVIVIANMIYCIREPYRLLILAVGKFKETNLGAIIEALLNIMISLLLVKSLGLLGVAIGTFVAIIYRLIYFIRFLNKDIMDIMYSAYIKSFIKIIILTIINIVCYTKNELNVVSVLDFVRLGIQVVTFETILVLSIYVGPKKIVHFIREKIEKYK